MHRLGIIVVILTLTVAACASEQPVEAPPASTIQDNQPDYLIGWGADAELSVALTDTCGNVLPKIAECLHMKLIIDASAESIRSQHLAASAILTRQMRDRQLRVTANELEVPIRLEKPSLMDLKKISEVGSGWVPGPDRPRGPEADLSEHRYWAGQAIGIFCVLMPDRYNADLDEGATTITIKAASK